MIWFLVFSLLANAVLLLLWKTHRKKKEDKAENAIPTEPKKSADPNEVGAFYDAQTDNFLKVYGEVIQAFRTREVQDLLDYQIEAIGLKNGWKVLDAGCGVAGPATHFASRLDLSIDAVTISKEQVKKAQKSIEEKGLGKKVRVHHGDYHLLHQQFMPQDYDAVYYLESFGHAQNHGAVLDAAWEVLKPGGTLYIKDLFIKEGAFTGHDKSIKKEVDNINKAYRYNVPDLYSILRHLRKKGFILAQLKTIDLPLEQFENLSVSNEFQELTGINKINDLKSYIFPVDFFELKCFKPSVDVTTGTNRYFLQNMYYMQVEGKKEEEL